VIRYLTIALKDELVLSTPADDNNADSQEDGE
jgi:hypothetical protein